MMIKYHNMHKQIIDTLNKLVFNVIKYKMIYLQQQLNKSKIKLYLELIRIKILKNQENLEKNYKH